MVFKQFLKENMLLLPRMSMKVLERQRRHYTNGKRHHKTHTLSNSSYSDVKVDMENNTELENREIADCIVIEF